MKQQNCDDCCLGSPGLRSGEWVRAVVRERGGSVKTENRVCCISGQESFNFTVFTSFKCLWSEEAALWPLWGCLAKTGAVEPVT